MAIRMYVHLALLLAACTWVRASDFFVDVNHPKASDDNAGTAEAPWKTITHAAATARAGDTVRIKGGRYREGNIQIKNHGERILEEPQPAYSCLLGHPLDQYWFQYITFQAHGPEEVVLDGTVELPSAAWKAVEGSANVYVAALPKVDGKLPPQIVWVFLNDDPLLPVVKAPGLTDGEGSKRYKPTLAMPSAADATSYPEKSISARGLGYWSVSLPTAPGTVTDLRLHVQARDVKPTEPRGGVLVCVEWSDYTRPCVRREVLVGRDEEGQEHMPEWMAGTYDFSPIDASATAPSWARRLRVFFGLRSCSGVVLFDDLDTIRARAGQAQAPEELKSP